MKANIQHVLHDFAEQKNIRVLFAVESGSRAWGFASPDSDWDVRFVFVRPVTDYLRLDALPDHLEHNHDELDIAGWDARKALTLMLKGNHAIREWLRSPIRYVTSSFIEEFYSLAQRTPSRQRLIFSYASLLYKTLRDYLSFDRDHVHLKKYFYAIRSALVLEWLAQQSAEHAVPPMHLAELLAEVTLPEATRQKINDLVARKSISHELGIGPRLPSIDEFIFAHNLGKIEPTKPASFSSDLLAAYDAMFRATVETPCS